MTLTPQYDALELRFDSWVTRKNYRRTITFAIRSKETSKTHNQLTVVVIRLTSFHLYCRSSPVDRQLANSVLSERVFCVACGDI